MNATHDVIVIGAGQAGPSVATHLSQRGKRIALVEQAKIGGTCLNVGCRPTKALRASARVAHLARNGAVHGVDVPDVTMNLATAMARKDAMIDLWRDRFTGYLESSEHIEIVRGHARLTGTTSGLHRVAVGERELSAELVVLDVGARARVPEIEGLDETPYLTNESILELRSVPGHLVILGGSYIGLELGQMFRRFGSGVTILEASSRIAGREDPDISAAIADMLREEGVVVRVDSEVTSVSGKSGTIRVDFAEGEHVEGTHLLLAVGRVPNTDRLGLGTVGLQPDERGYLRTDGVFRTEVPGIIALGDINGRGAFTHTAYQDAEIFIDHLEGGSRTADDRIMTYAMFTDPPLGRVGMNEAEALITGKRVLRATYSMKDVTKAVLEGETAGFVKILVDGESDRFLGAACFALFGDEIVQVVSALMHADAPCTVLADMLPVHPTVAEFFPTILQRLEPLGSE